MTGAKFDIEKFDETGYFGLWRIKMRALLIQHGCEAALEVLREVTRETTVAGVWSKLETLYMTNSLANKFYLKKKLYTFYMPVGRKIFEHIDEFNKIVLDLANIEVKFEDEDLAILLLTSLPTSYKTFMGYFALWTGDFDLKGRDGHTKFKGNQRNSRGKPRSKSRGGRLKCYICQSEDHLKRNCSKNNRKKSTGYVKKDDQLSSVVRFMMILSILLGDNMECKIRGLGKVRVQLRDGSSFVLHNVRYILELKRNLISLGTLKKEGYTVKLQSGKVKVINGSRVVLSGTRRDNCVYSLDGHVVRGGTTGAGKARAVWQKESRRVWVYILRFKHEASGKFKEWKQLVENQTRRTVKKLRTDNGLEFCNREFEQLCVESGIAIHLTVVGTPQQNRLAERMNRTLMDKRLYRLDDESPKIVTSKNVVFNESAMYKDTLKDSGAGADKSVEELQVERAKDKNETFNFRDESNMAAYVFVAEEEEDTHEPLTYQEAVPCEDSSKWKAIKEGIEGVQKPRYKARLVSRGFTQRACIDQNEVFSLVVRHTSIRVILALTACKDYELEQLDVKTAFLHGNLEEMIYMRQPPGYEQDDMLIACKSKAEIGSTKSLLKKEFDMNELGEANKILDDGKSVQMPLGGHFKLSLKDYPVRDCNVERMSKVPYENAVRSLMYLMVCTRKDIAYAYLRGTENVGFMYGTNRGNHVGVTGFVDSEYGKDPDKEAGCMALTKAVKEAIWLRGLLEELSVKLNNVAVNCDNQGEIHLLRNHVFHERTKHINVRYHFIREVLEVNTVKV
ncbi:retrotransposon protein, putative, ty1-copia subclass [Tanacetum coccineum]|uniref:Retrotransposon protein, putative, ty1-copia subclass n=1 Tax=Tanacetum coccineum TaxID=301880 RepID=A0ABQ5E4L1_9ASTR